MKKNEKIKVVKMIVDANNVVVGRLATIVAKKLLNGEEVFIVNAENAVISGNPKKVVEKYFNRRQVQQKANPEHSVKWPRRPDFLLKRIIRGMLPKKSSRGKQALHRLKCFIGVPKEFEEKQFERIGKTSEELMTRFVSLKELCKRLGWPARA